MIKKILIGLGGTDFTTVAVQRAVELARRHGATLTGITVLDKERLGKVGPVPAGGGAYALRMAEKRIEQTQERINEAVARLENACAGELAFCLVEQETGDPFDLMIAHSRYNDLMVFGLKSLFDYGLVSDPQDALIRLIAGGVRPILAVSACYREIRRALVAYNGSMESASSMRRFVQLRLWPDVRFRVLHIRDKAGTQAPEKLTADAAAYIAAHGFAVDTDIVAGSPREDLLAYAREYDLDVIVMGNSRKSTWVRRLLGDTVLHAIQNADRPLFLSQ
jgi:nucleotide-binding universal stress UspA family protein